MLTQNAQTVGQLTAFRHDQSLQLTLLDDRVLGPSGRGRCVATNRELARLASLDRPDGSTTHDLADFDRWNVRPGIVKPSTHGWIDTHVVAFKEDLSVLEVICGGSGIV